MSHEPAVPTPSLPDIVQRYLDGESIQVLASESARSPRTLYNWLIAECGPEYDAVVTEGLINRVADADVELLNARDSIQIARAREIAKFARMDLERRRPKLYGPKQEVQTDNTIRVLIEPVTPHIDQQPKTIEAVSQVVDNTQDDKSANV